MRSFADALNEDRVYVFDGAMGTMLYSKGVYINRCYDELNLQRPDLVREVHQEYARAGAEVLETNTFGANRLKLAHYGLEEQVQEINRSAARIAREAAGETIYVAGALGPLGVRMEPYGPTSMEEARRFFREQSEGLLEGGVDLFVLETFSDLAEIQQALLAIRELCPLPIVAQMTIHADSNTAFGTAPEVFTRRLDDWGADVIGVNCSEGPAGILDAIARMAAVTTRKLSAQPNAGQPHEVGGRSMYMASPEYMSRFAKRMIQAGARFIGGCCGTTPAHIKEISNTVRALSPRRTFHQVAAPETQAPPLEPVPTDQRSRFAARISRGEFVTSVEIVPPRGCDPSEMLASVRLLKEAGVDAVNVPDGPRAQSRMGVLATSLLIEQQIGIETVVHYCCRDRNLLGMLSDLLGAAAMGLRNLLIITGDPPKMGPYPDATAVFDIDSIGLTNMVTRLNMGLDLGGNPIGKPTAFLTGVGVNPTAVDLDYEIRRFEWKVEAGAQFAITQPVFDTAQLRHFLQRIEHCRIPVIAGLWPLVSFRNAEFLSNEVPGVVVPPIVLERMRQASAEGREAAVAAGVAIAREMLRDVRELVQGVQVSAPFGRVPVALEVFEELKSGQGTGAAAAVSDR